MSILPISKTFLSLYNIENANLNFLKIFFYNYTTKLKFTKVKYLNEINKNTAKKDKELPILRPY